MNRKNSISSDEDCDVPIRPQPVVDPEMLYPPTPTKNHLISPPSSPPVGWHERRETKPNPGIEIEILSKVAELKPGQKVELIPGTIKTPQICVHICEPDQNHNSIKIQQTKRPPL